MKSYLLILPVAFLVAYSQVAVKWRSTALVTSEQTSYWKHLLHLISDPVIFSAYLSALLASFAWLFVVTKLPLTTAFPVYIGTTFVMVLIGGSLFLAEEFNPIKVLAVLMIMGGIILGIKAHA